MPGNEPIRSVLHALDLLSVLAEADNGLTMSELTDVTGLKRPTAHNLLRTLAERNFVSKTGNAYRVGSAVFSLAASAAGADLLTEAEATVLRIAERFSDATVSYSEVQHGKVIARIMKRPNRRLSERNTGYEMTPYHTASGLGMLAHADVELRNAIQIEHPFQIEGQSAWGDETSLEEYLAEVRSCGFVHPPFCAISKYKLVAVPVANTFDHVDGIYGIAWYERDNEPNERRSDESADPTRPAASGYAPGQVAQIIRAILSETGFKPVGCE